LMHVNGAASELCNSIFTSARSLPQGPMTGGPELPGPQAGPIREPLWLLPGDPSQPFVRLLGKNAAQ
jgi:hypothetical protein